MMKTNVFVIFFSSLHINAYASARMIFFQTIKMQQKYQEKNHLPFVLNSYL